jgi:hypothetical protein
VQRITAEGATSNKELRQKLLCAVYTVRRFWPINSKHSSKSSATCDLVHMPRELLPHVWSRVIPDRWPYISESTISDVLVMRHIRHRHSQEHYRTLWATLQRRLLQYAGTGAGTVAETILCNHCWWNEEIAHEAPPLSSRSTAGKRRRARSASSKHKGSMQ